MTKSSPYESGEVNGDNPIGHGLEESVHGAFERTREVMAQLLSDRFGFRSNIKDRNDNDHEIEAEDIVGIEVDDEVSGGYRVNLKDGKTIAIIGATAFSILTAAVIYKKTKK